MMLNYKLILCLSFFITSCTSMCSRSHEDLSAEEVVEAYLNFAFNMTDVSQKYKLMAFTTGSLKAAIAGASDEVIQEAYISNRYNLTGFSLIERRDRTPRETEIAFQISYKELPKDSKDWKEAAEISTENTIALIKEKGKWLLHDVIGNKTTIDFPLSAVSTISAKKP